MISDLVPTLLKAGLPASRIVVNGLNYQTVESLDRNLGFHIKEKEAYLFRDLVRSFGAKLDHSLRMRLVSMMIQIYT